MMRRPLLALLLLSVCSTTLFAAEPKAADAPVPLNPEGTILLDKAQGKVLLKTRICLVDGVLEMFACPKQTKEHESIVALDGPAHLVHAGLLALGIEPGRPARFEPEFSPPIGPQIDIFVVWKDAEGKEQRRRAQEWIRHATHRYFEAPLAKVPDGVKLAEGDDSLRYDRMNSLLLWYGTMSDVQREEFLSMSDNQEYQQAVRSLHEQSQPRQMQADFVFAGSAFRRLENGQEVYLAESGSLICVANFGDAMIDINTRSTSSNDAGLLYEPWTERLPPLNTPVTVELIPAGKSSAE